MQHLKSLLASASLAAAGLLASSGAAALALIPVDYGHLSGTLVNFETLPAAGPDGSLLEGIVSVGGVQFGERFAGQLLSVTKAQRPGEIAQDWFDDLGGGLPLTGLTLLAGASGENLGVYDYGGSAGKALAGIGPRNLVYGGDPFGFGAISARFASGQSALGFELHDIDGGNAFLSLYRLDGSLIETVGLGPLTSSFYAYAREGGVADIAGFSLYNVDSYYGISLDNLVYGTLGVSAVPEPASLALLLAGLGAVGLTSRRRV